MRLLLSAEDLIALLDRSDPFTPKKFEEWLRSHDACLVLTGTNVVEASVPLLDAGKTTQLRTMLHALTALPVSYLKEMAIFVEELGGALVAFGREREPLSVDPYVTKWSDTLGVSLGKSYSSLGIYETVAHLWRSAPETLLHFHRYQEILAEELVAESLPAAAEPASPVLLAKRFARYVERQLQLHGFALPQPGPGAFADWVYSNSRRCPGLRLAFELSQEIISNSGNSLAPPPLRGWGHLHAIPYVDAITIEQPLLGYCQSAGAALQRGNSAVSYDGRIHPGLDSLLKQWP